MAVEDQGIVTPSRSFFRELVRRDPIVSDNNEAVRIWLFF
jgi:hypothetical protein